MMWNGSRAAWARPGVDAWLPDGCVVPPAVREWLDSNPGRLSVGTVHGSQVTYSSAHPELAPTEDYLYRGAELRDEPDLCGHPSCTRPGCCGGHTVLADPDEGLPADSGAYGSAVRLFLARHDRARGMFWADLMRGLVSLCTTESEDWDRLARDRLSNDDLYRSHCNGQAMAYDDAAHRILAILDELHEDGQC